MLNIKKPYFDLNGVEKFFVSLYGESNQTIKQRYENVFENFKRYFNKTNAYFASSSGRVEMCGNHTDHNGGRVVSCAISLDTLCAFLPTDDNVIKVKSEGYDQMIVDLSKDANEEKGTSPALIRGVVEGYKKAGFKVGGFIAYMTSNVLGGAGISSSASFEVLISKILSFIYNEDKVSCQDMAKISQFSENSYFGKPCGLLDQTAIAFGGLKLLDFKDKNEIVVKNVDNSLKDFTLVLVNTGGSHANLTNEYASIPYEMKHVASNFGCERLIDMTEQEFYENLSKGNSKLEDREIVRAVHFYEENKRVDCVYNSLNNNNDYRSYLNAINNSGISSLCFLQNCFVGGSKEQPITKALAITKEFNKNGANRVHGGGFAGTILNIVRNEELNKFIENVSKFYDKKDIIPLKVRTLGTIVL